MACLGSYHVLAGIVRLALALPSSLLSLFRRVGGRLLRLKAALGGQASSLGAPWCGLGRDDVLAALGSTSQQFLVTLLLGPLVSFVDFNNQLASSF